MQQQTKKSGSGIRNLISVIILVVAVTYAWPSALTAIEKGAYEGAKAGAEAGAKAVVTAAIDKAKTEIPDAINEALPWSQ